jgi:hypothetical protein
VPSAEGVVQVSEDKDWEMVSDIISAMLDNLTPSEALHFLSEVRECVAPETWKRWLIENNLEQKAS